MNTPKSLAALRAAWEPLACRFCMLAPHHMELARWLCAAAMLAVSLLAGCAALPNEVPRVAVSYTHLTLPTNREV